MKKRLFVYCFIFLAIYIILNFNEVYFTGKSSNMKNGKFFNSFEQSEPVKSRTEGRSVNKWLLNRAKTKVKWTEYDRINFAKFAQYQVKSRSNDLEVVFINHASFLIQVEGLNIITDPIWSERASPVSFFGPKRFIPTPFKINELPRIDYILVSHSHFDHLDLPTIKKLVNLYNSTVIAGLGTCKFLLKRGIKNCIQQDWGQGVEVKQGFNIVFEPAKHWSKRSLFDTNKILWGSFVIITPKFKIYFAGDTGYGKHFRMIGEKYNNFDVALLPVGAYEPRDIMQYSHINPYEAVLAHKDLNSNVSLGMHLKTFQLTDEGFNDPVVQLNKAKIDLNIRDNSFKVLNFGERYKIIK